jgi:N-acetylglucosaminyl-diphospho-decaprenol L-rhamnosyltransferase
VIELSIVIVSFNSRADLERCLSSLHHPPPAISHEIIVVDNASTDESVRAAREWPRVQVIESPTNRGFAAANNAAIRQSVGKTLLILNPDTIVPPGAIDRLVTELGNHPDAAAIGPRLVDGNGHAELSFGSMIAPLAELRQRRLMRGLERGDPTVRSQVEAMTRQEHWTDWVSGACLLVWRQDAEAVGLLDERYVMYTEDVDFCAALRARGRRVLFTPAVEIVHLRGRSAATAPDATRAAYRHSHLAFYQKHHPALAPFLRLYHWLRPI